MQQLSTYQFLLLFAGILVLRYFHLGPELDLPHDWRQADTAYYIYDFYRNGIDLFHPEVCWMGTYGKVVFEFPLPEAIVAGILRQTGDSMLVTRLVFLLFFCVAVYYFYRIVQLVFGERLARWSTLVYLSLPLSLFYSRAIHIDFFALGCAYAMLYYFLQGVKKRKWRWLLVSSLVAIPAFLVKAPYGFYLVFPMLVYAWEQKAVSWLLPRGLFYLLPLIAFWVWQNHVYEVNSQAPDWDYILNYRKFNDNAHWYYGSLKQRLSLYSWKVLTQRMVLEVMGIGGIIFVMIGLFKSQAMQKNYFLWSWIVGLGIYLITFFNLNFVHNYYQIPFLAVAAILGGKGLVILDEKQRWYAWLGLLFLILLNVGYAERSYYQVPEELEEIAGYVKEYTPEEALVIVTYQNFDCKNPRILYRARRKGWSIEEAGLSKTVLQKLVEEEGASHWVYVGKNLPDMDLDSESIQSLDSQYLEESKDSIFLITWK